MMSYETLLIKFIILIIALNSILAEFTVSVHHSLNSPVFTYNNISNNNFHTAYYSHSNTTIVLNCSTIIQSLNPNTCSQCNNTNNTSRIISLKWTAKNFTSYQTMSILYQSIIRVNITNKSDSGNFTCHFNASQITVHLLRVSVPSITSSSMPLFYINHLHNATLYVSIREDTPPLLVVWLLNNNTIISDENYKISNIRNDGITNYTLFISKISNETIGSYSFSISNSVGAVNRTFYLRIQPPSVSFTSSNYYNQSSKLICIATGYPKPIIQWFYYNNTNNNNNNTSSRNSSSIMLVDGLLNYISINISNNSGSDGSIITSSYLTFPDSSINISGYYQCAASIQFLFMLKENFSEFVFVNYILPPAITTILPETTPASNSTTSITASNSTTSITASNSTTSITASNSTTSMTTNFTVYSTVLGPIDNSYTLIFSSVFSSLFLIILVIFCTIGILFLLIRHFQAYKKFIVDSRPPKPNKTLNITALPDLTHSLNKANAMNNHHDISSLSDVTVPLNSSTGSIGYTSYAMIELLTVETRVEDVLVRNFPRYLEELKANDKLKYSEYYELIRRKSPVLACDIASLKENRGKNRYNNIACFDHTRVKLVPYDETHNNFIHANFITGYNRENEYIATQGPLENTIGDFWRMIWEYNCDTIVMLTRCMENLKKKCALYWPKEGIKQYFLIKVTHISTAHLVDYSIYKLEIIPEDYSGPCLNVTLLQFLSWPDFGTPISPAPLLHFRNKIREYHPIGVGAPLVVHCSAGVGRSGTFISLDVELQRALSEDRVNPFKQVLEMRQERNHMVQTEVQFVFLHEAILEGILYGYEDYHVSEYPTLMMNLERLDEETNIGGYELDFKALNSPKIKFPQFSDANLLINVSKNRNPKALPYNKNRVKLTMLPGAEGSDYINASTVDSFVTQNMFLVTQAPLENTIFDFWRMIFERDVYTIITLCSLIEDNKEACAKYWPDEGGELDLPTMTVINDTEFFHTDVMLTERDLTVNHKKLNITRKIKHYHYAEWSENIFPDNFEGIGELLEITEDSYNERKKSPIVIHCSSGIGRTGVFCAVYNTIEQIKIDNSINLFYIIKKIRLQRAQIVLTLDQYKLCYKIIEKYIQNNSHNDDNNDLV